LIGHGASEWLFRSGGDAVIEHLEQRRSTAIETITEAGRAHALDVLLNLTTTDGDIPEDVVASYVSPNAPNHWGVPALMGRWLIPADAPPGQDPAPVVVLGYEYWRARLGARDGGRVSRIARRDRRPIAGRARHPYRHKAPWRENFPVISAVRPLALKVFLS
jgi:hypothetical protein